MKNKQYYFTLRGIFKRTKEEYNYYFKRPWSLEDVGKFWDTVTDYDDVNETLYTYFRRFTNSEKLASDFLVKEKYKMLDIQARSGKGTLFWYEKGKVSEATCCDFSDFLTRLAQERLENISVPLKTVKVLHFPLPFEDKKFDFVCSYETIEHVFEYQTFVNELARVMTDDGIMIITCPNVAWEWVHWLTAIININHSEGPHRFLRRAILKKTFKNAGLAVLRENSTILMPFNNKTSIKTDRFLEKYLPERIKSLFALRRTFILAKQA